MNIFVVDDCPEKSARSLCDKHVVKMILESAQMMSTTHRVLDGEEYYDLSKNNRRIKRWKLSDPREETLWKATFVNHPCTRWTMETSENYKWHWLHALTLCCEYTSRYEKIHSAQNLIENILCGLPRRIPSGELTPFAQAMPDIYKDDHDAVNAYRNYYNGTKTRFAKWKNGKVPHWFRSETLTT